MELTLNELVVGAVLGSMSLVLLFSFISRGHRLQARMRVKSRVIICRLCLHAFQAAGSEQIVKCPQCGAANQKGRNRSLG